MSKYGRLDLSQSGEGRVAFITGAASGIGLATAKLFAHCGYKIGMFDLNPEITEIAAETNRDEPDLVIGLQGDVTDADRVNRALTLTTGKFGRVDVLVCCAGVVRPDDPAAGPKLEDLLLMLQINAVGTFNAINAAKGIMEFSANAGGDPSIIAIGSIAGELALNDRTGYCASKGALHSLMQATMVSYAKLGIDVTTVAPGRVLTDLVAAWVGQKPQAEQAEAFREGCATQVSGTMLLPEEVAGQILFLASPLGKPSRNGICDMSCGWANGHQAYPRDKMPPAFEAFRKKAQALYPRLNLIPKEN